MLKNISKFGFYDDLSEKKYDEWSQLLEVITCQCIDDAVKDIRHKLGAVCLRMNVRPDDVIAKLAQSRQEKQSDENTLDDDGLD